jgi:hypothetical protein
MLWGFMLPARDWQIEDAGLKGTPLLHRAFAIAKAEGALDKLVKSGEFR